MNFLVLKKASSSSKEVRFYFNKLTYDILYKMSFSMHEAYDDISLFQTFGRMERFRLLLEKNMNNLEFSVLDCYNEFLKFRETDEYLDEFVKTFPYMCFETDYYLLLGEKIEICSMSGIQETNTPNIVHSQGKNLGGFENNEAKRVWYRLAKLNRPGFTIDGCKLIFVCSHPNHPEKHRFLKMLNYDLTEKAQLIDLE
jgi:hypothetical protein